MSALLSCRYVVEERMTVDARSDETAPSWRRASALNEVTVEKGSRARLFDLIAEVDGRPVSRWGCDGIVFATPTGSTAYAFSAGAPVVWPEVSALLLVPINAHALFSRPLVVAPDSVLAAEVVAGAGDAVLFADGRLVVGLPFGSRVEVRRGSARYWWPGST